MKRILAIVFLVIILVATWWLFFKNGNETTKNSEMTETGAIQPKKHSDLFNDRVNQAVNAYMILKDAFVNADTALARQQSIQFVTMIDQIPLNELSADEPQIANAARQQISDIKANAQPIATDENISEMRHDFYMVSENLYPFLKTIGYEGEKLYWQNCPMAFGDDQEANWLSTTAQISNPYLGKNHPKYKSSMLRCGEVKDSIYAH